MSGIAALYCVLLTWYFSANITMRLLYVIAVSYWRAYGTLMAAEK